MSLFIKSISFYNPIKFLAILFPTSLANLMFEVRTRHSRQILLMYSFILITRKLNLIILSILVAQIIKFAISFAEIIFW